MGSSRLCFLLSLYGDQTVLHITGRFGNQAEHFLGAIAFAKALDRTLILPPWRTYKNIPFSDFFQVEPLRSYHQVILAEDFMKHLAPSHWPKGKRHGYCWLPPGSGAQCRMKDGNPFKPFWDELGVDFDEKIVYHLGTRVQDPYERDKWKKEFPPSNHPVLAFRGAPASFPVEEQNRQVHAFLKWSDKINEEVDEYIKSTLPPGPFVGIHLRNGIDWVQVFHLNPWLPQLDLAILGRADHFIGNCVSSFSSFVKRERDFNGKPSSFFAFDD
ncbi:GDP-fucose protein O-fucosyltransferase 1-like isoform X2 [Montipora foliosa]|uniref:GDP-fucose protein O-fucosyltransferase 1-like isoform X2 n=1 Tax=Montipora foliosa TaxID=591990 RepID=UPI0035F13DF2